MQKIAKIVVADVILLTHFQNFSEPGNLKVLPAGLIMG